MSKAIGKRRRALTRKHITSVPLSIIRAIICFGHGLTGPRGFSTLTAVVDYMDDRFFRNEYFSKKRPNISIASAAFPALSSDRIYLWGDCEDRRGAVCTFHCGDNSDQLSEIKEDLIEGLSDWALNWAGWKKTPAEKPFQLLMPSPYDRDPILKQSVEWERYIFTSKGEVLHETCKRNTPSSFHISLHR